MTAAVPQPAFADAPPLVGDFLARARARLLPEPQLDGEARRGDHELNPGHLELAVARPVKAAAVLIPVVARPEPTVLLTLRSAHLPNHAGQISFPGGKVDPADPDPLHTALREAEEEVGLDRARVTPLGYLDRYLSRTGFRIVPVVGLVQPDFGLTLNPGEVDEAFEVPLDFLMTPANYRPYTRESEGMIRVLHSVTYEKRFVWGITAGILRALHDRVYG